MDDLDKQLRDLVDYFVTRNVPYTPDLLRQIAKDAARIGAEIEREECAKAVLQSGAVDSIYAARVIVERGNK